MNKCSHFVLKEEDDEKKKEDDNDDWRMYEGDESSNYFRFVKLIA